MSATATAMTAAAAAQAHRPMFANLLKHEFIRTRGWILATFGAVTGLVALGLAAEWLEIPVLRGILLIFSIAATAAVLLTVQVLLACNYWRTSYGHVGYLTQTLPVHGTTIYWAKLLWAQIVTLVGFALTLLLVLGCYWIVAHSLGMPLNPFQTVDRMSTMMGLEPGQGMSGLILLTTGVALLWFVVNPFVLFFCASLGAEEPLNRMGAAAPFLVGVLTWIASQILVFGLLAALPWSFELVGGHIGFKYAPITETLDTARAKARGIFPVAIFAMPVVVGILAAWRTHRSWNHRVALN